MSVLTEKEEFAVDVLEYIANYYRDKDGNIQDINKVVDIANSLLDSYEEMKKIKEEL
jgi:hypothetical protein